MKPWSCNGWTIYFHPLFAKQFQSLIAEVEKLKQRLPQNEFATHQSVKRLQAVREAIRNKIPSDPFAAHFSLKKPLDKFCRLKKMGLNERYRLFFKASKHDDKQVIIVLWLGYPRKEGDKKDCYEVFKKMVQAENLCRTIDELIADCENA